MATAYGARWQIELLFREMKSSYGVEEMPSRKRHVVEALLYARAALRNFESYVGRAAEDEQKTRELIQAIEGARRGG